MTATPAWAVDIPAVGEVTPWDRLELAGIVCPGLARVNVVVPNDLDIAKPKGGKKATITDEGDPLQEVSITLTMQPADANKFFAEVMPKLRPRGKNRGRAPVKAAHPMLALFGVAALAIGDIKANQPNPGGFMVVEISAWEYAAAPTPVKKKKKDEKPASADEAAALSPEAEAVLDRIASGQGLDSRITPYSDDNYWESLL
jgi:hypothetical protein